MPSVPHHSRRLEKSEILTISEFDEIQWVTRFRETILTVKSISSFEIYKIYRFPTKITDLPFLEKLDFSRVLHSSPLKEFHPEFHTHTHRITCICIHTQPHAYKLVILSQMTKPHTFILKQERIGVPHHVLALPHCLLHSSVLPQHLQ